MLGAYYCSIGLEISRKHLHNYNYERIRCYPSVWLKWFQSIRFHIMTFNKQVDYSCLHFNPNLPLKQSCPKSDNLLTKYEIDVDVLAIFPFWWDVMKKNYTSLFQSLLSKKLSSIMFTEKTEIFRAINISSNLSLQNLSLHFLHHSYGWIRMPLDNDLSLLHIVFFLCIQDNPSVIPTISKCSNTNIEILSFSIYVI